MIGSLLQSTPFTPVRDWIAAGIGRVQRAQRATESEQAPWYCSWIRKEGSQKTDSA